VTLSTVAPGPASRKVDVCNCPTSPTWTPADEREDEGVAAPEKTRGPTTHRQSYGDLSGGVGVALARRQQRADRGDGAWRRVPGGAHIIQQRFDRFVACLLTMVVGS
jgi:hypothetical protein